jgi:ABC-type dipeptide/oligopeptide/nickel transport system ATPase component
MAPAAPQNIVLSVENLRTEFPTRSGTVVAVDQLSFDLRERETLAIVGESGSGKSVTALSILSLIPKSAGRISAGVVRPKVAISLRSMPTRCNQCAVARSR